MRQWFLAQILVEYDTLFGMVGAESYTLRASPLQKSVLWRFEGFLF